MKEEIHSFLLFFLLLEGEHSGAFIKILHCIQDHKWNAKQGWEGSELRNKSEAIPYRVRLFCGVALHEPCLPSND
jgi:hypothetical protein